MHTLGSLSLLLGRLLIASIFLMSGLQKFFFYHETAALLTQKHLPYVPYLLYSAAVAEILGALCLILGWKTRFGAAILILFLIPATVLFHDFWHSDPSAKPLMIILFMKNLAIFGGLFYVLAAGPGGISLDRLCQKK